jgi:hypothetical protein
MQNKEPFLRFLIKIYVFLLTLLTVQFYYEKLNFCDVLSKHKSKGLDINSLLIGLLSYKLTENFSIKEAGNWVNRKKILEILTLRRKVPFIKLSRQAKILGRNSSHDMGYLILEKMIFGKRSEKFIGRRGKRGEKFIGRSVKSPESLAQGI